MYSFLFEIGEFVFLFSAILHIFEINIFPHYFFVQIIIKSEAQYKTEKKFQQHQNNFIWFAFLAKFQVQRRFRQTRAIQGSQIGKREKEEALDSAKTQLRTTL